ncbi:MAG: Hsp20/alpha crystallin family protein [Planctomycetota bacterium]|nr:MAG: Hsp20/alpha crystallin family protein [Planctomycetota bacterium]
MAVFRWGHSWPEFRDLEREVDRLLQTMNATFQGFRIGRLFPPINVYELDDEYLLTAEVPGVAAEDLELTVADGILTLKGCRENPQNVPEEAYRRRERATGYWERSIDLPERVEDDKLRAVLNNGVLVVHLPKAEAAIPRRVPIAVGNGSSDSGSARRIDVGAEHAPREERDAENGDGPSEAGQPPV